jgi:hypothetical protein
LGGWGIYISISNPEPAVFFYREKQEVLDWGIYQSPIHNRWSSSIEKNIEVLDWGIYQHPIQNRWYSSIEKNRRFWIGAYINLQSITGGILL